MTQSRPTPAEAWSEPIGCAAQRLFAAELKPNRRDARSVSGGQSIAQDWSPFAPVPDEVEFIPLPES